MLTGILFALSGCSTQTRSSQIIPDEIGSYFNHPLAGIEHDFHDYINQSKTFLPVLRGLIQNAIESLDLALFSITLPEVIEDLNSACSRGIAVRIVTELDSALSQHLSSCIKIRFAQNDRLMHDKFMIVDHQKVWTGSANWTEGSFYNDDNDGLLITNQAFAQAYLSEFDEMFAKQRFGKKKQNNSREHFEVAAHPVEVYFSPSDHPRRRLLELINGAQKSIELAIYSLTDNDIANALKDALKRGVRIDALWDFQSDEKCQFSEADDFSKQGIGTVEAGPGLLHHKFAIIDGEIVITGSTNWSVSGFDYNDENLVIIHSQELAQSYQTRFDELREDADTFSKNPNQPPRLEVRHFDIVPGAALVQWRPQDLNVVEQYEICRTRQLNQSACEKSSTLPGWAWYFLDRGVVPNERYFYRVRSIVGDRKSAYSNPYETVIPSGSSVTLDQEDTERDFQENQNKQITTQILVDNVYVSSNGNLFLNSGEDFKSDLSAFIPGCALERFNGSGLDLFALKGKRIEVSGELQEYNGPEIVVTSPWQIRVVDNSL